MTSSFGMEYLDANEVCKLLKISQSTLKRWRTEGKIKFVKLSERKFLYPKSEIQLLLEG